MSATRRAAARELGSLALALSAAVSAHAGRPLPVPAIDPAEKLEVSLSSHFWEPPISVAMPVRARVRNLDGRPRRVALVFSSGSAMGAFGTTCRSRHELWLEPLGTVEADLVVPLCPALDGPATPVLTSQVQAVVVGTRTTSEALIASRNFIPSSTIKAPSASVALSESVAARSWEPLRIALETQGIGLVGSRFSPDELPRDWRGWASFAGVVMSGEEWRGLEAATRDAALDFVASGGTLLLAEETTGERLHGLGRIRALPAAGLELDVEAAVAALRSLRAPALANPPDHAGSPLVTRLGAQATPTRPLAALMVLYAVAVGPLNLWLHRGPRRHHVFWTTPLIASVACALLFGAIVLRDGFGGRGLRFAAVVIMPEENQAVVLQEQAARTGVLVHSGFAVRESVLAVPLLGGGAFQRRRYEQSGELWWGDWFASRAVQGQLLEAVVPSRSRVTLVETPGGRAVVSSIATRIPELHLVDAQGGLWHALDLLPGRPAPLLASEPARARAFWERELAAAGPRVRELLQPLRGQPGWFYAHAETGPGAPIEAGPPLDWRDDQVLLLGRIE